MRSSEESALSTTQKEYNNLAFGMRMREEEEEEEKKREDKRNEKAGGETEVDSGLSLVSLLASKDRDFLIAHDGTQVKISDLHGKIVGIYFSANWYPPCRTFTTLLSSTYEQIKNYDPGFEIVFVSSDEDLDAFEEYRASMPWLAIPFSDMGTKRALSTRFDIEDIPCLIILHPKSNQESCVTLDGVDLVSRYGAQAFPFTRMRVEELKETEKHKHDNQTLEDLLTHPQRDFLISHREEKQVPVSSLHGKTIGLYFSAQWCSPGVKFTTKLASIYQKINHLPFEIVFVCTDQDEPSFDSCFQTMPWLALPHGDPNIKNLARHFDVRVIPALVILGPDGKTVTNAGRNLINLYRENAYPFTESRIKMLKMEDDEEAVNLPRFEKHSGHDHELVLVSEGNGGGPFVCCDCGEQGASWAYQCLDCGYEVHPKCVRGAKEGLDSGSGG